MKLTPRTATYNRRDFLQHLGVSVLSCAFASEAMAAVESVNPPRNSIPQWRGFNLLNFFQALSRGETGDGQVREDDLRWMRDWGFDFVRLPMDYWFWIDADWKTTRTLSPDATYRIKEAALENIDRVVDLCRRYHLHLSLNFHRAPGYCINDPEREPFVLWNDSRAEDAFVHHWECFARRYRNIPPDALSFNLLNEAPSPREGYMTRQDYCRVMTRATEAIRRLNPDRLIIIDGLRVGTEVVTEMISSGVGQSVHAYFPGEISHYRASWVDRNASFPEPAWPVRDAKGAIKYDRAVLEKRYAPWAALMRQGIGVHCGECGCYNKTPYRVFMAWFTDVLDILKSHHIGYALWNLRGSFGVVDSGRTDVAYDNWRGHQLDRELLALLQRH